MPGKGAVLPAHVVGKYPNASSQEFTQMTTDILKEFGERYGEKIAGYWFDGFYQCFEISVSS